MHIRVPEDGDTDCGDFDPPAYIDKVFVCNVDALNKTVDVSASPLKGSVHIIDLCHQAFY